MNVLILEPNPKYQEELRALCTIEPELRITVVDSTLSAAVTLLQSTYDVVITDYQAALQDDHYLITYCQNATPPIPILFTLAESELQTPSAQYWVGSADYMFKPFVTQDLLFRLRRLCQLSTPTALIITPHEDLAQQVQWALSGQGILTFVIPNRATFAEAMVTHSPRVILWDVLSDTAASAHVADELTQHAALIAISPLSGLSAPQTQALLKSHDYIGIPFAPIDLETRVKKILRHHFAPATISATPQQTEMDQLKVALHHEIRNPLTSIMIGAQALAHQFPEGTAEKNVLTTIENSSQRIKSIMDALSSAKPPFAVEHYVDGVQMLKLPW